MKRAQIMFELRVAGFVTTDRAMRQTIESLVKDDGELIGSSSKGYFLIQTRAEAETAREFFRSRAISELQRGNALIRNWNKHQPEHQLELFGEEI